MDSELLIKFAREIPSIVRIKIRWDTDITPKYLIKYHAWDICIAAAKKGRLDVLELMKSVDSLTLDSDAIYLAALYGHMSILKWRKSIYGCPKYIYAILLASAQSGNTEIFKWALDDSPKDSYTFSRWCNDIIDTATRYGKLEILTCLYEYWTSNYPMACVVINYNAANNAAAGGYLEILLWLREHKQLRYTNVAIDYAACNGHLHIIEWFKNSGLPFKYQYAINYAIQMGHLNILEWFYNSGYKLVHFKWKIEWDQVSQDVKKWYEAYLKS
jgi:hypothetical protein